MVAGIERPPFEPGNRAALKHGAYSEREVAEAAVAIHRSLLDAAPWLREPHFLPAVSRYLRAAAREQLLDSHIRRVSADSGPGAVPSRVWEQATAAARLAAKLGSELGLDPTGHARLQALAVSTQLHAAGLEQLAEQGRDALEQRLAVIDAGGKVET